MNRIIFLDFDGVLNNRPWLIALQSTERAMESFNTVDADRVAHLNHIVRETGALVVVSSTWRRGKSRDALQAILCAAGFEGRVVGTTPKTSLRRGAEIQMWLDGLSSEHGMFKCEEEGGTYFDEAAEYPDPDDPPSFVIIDDDGDMEHLMHRLVQTSFEEGLQAAHAAQAVAMLQAAGSRRKSLLLPAPCDKNGHLEDSMTLPKTDPLDARPEGDADSIFRVCEFLTAPAHAVRVPTQIINEAVEMLDNPIRAIVHIRDSAGLKLYEAKQIVDDLLYSRKRADVSEARRSEPPTDDMCMAALRTWETVLGLCKSGTPVDGIATIAKYQIEGLNKFLHEERS